jgi:DNA-directed RNA polymerase specialized sigma24 family protein
MDNRQHNFKSEKQAKSVSEEVYRENNRTVDTKNNHQEPIKHSCDERGKKHADECCVCETQENQKQSHERKIYIKDLRKWVPVSKTDYDNYYRDINAYRRRQQEHGRCVCPASKRYLCDMDCWTCRFRKAGDVLSLDYTASDENGNEKSWLDDLADDSPNTLSIIEERELLDTLISKLDMLDPDGRRICELLLQEKSEREIAAILGISRQSTINYKKKKAFEALREILRDYI